MTVRPYYDQDGIRIFLGDCRDVLPTLPGAADLALTDPPYLVDYRGRWGRHQSIANDRSDEWLEPAFAALYAALKDDGICVSFYGWPAIERFMAAWRAAGFRPVSHMVWIKNVWGLGYYTRGQHEQGFVLAKPASRKPDAPISDVLDWRRVQRPVHPTEKPVGALRTIVSAFCPASGVVIDPFMGSGTTLRAAKDAGRKAIGIEIEERYVEIAIQRLEQSVMRLEVPA